MQFKIKEVLSDRIPICFSVLEAIALALFAPAYFLFWRRGILIGEESMKSIVSSDYVREFFVRHDDLDWKRIIEEASELDVVVFYYDAWVRKHHDSLVTFFSNGGRLTFIMSNPGDLELLGIIQQHFFPRLTEDALAQRIRATENALVDARRQARGARRSALDIRYFPSVLHYSFVLQNKRQLYLSVYEQFRGPHVRSSVFRIDLTADSGLEEYWLTTLDEFKKQTAPPPKLAA